MRHAVFCLSLSIAAFGAANTLEAGRIVVFGDSWGVPFAPALQQVLTDNGLSSVTAVNAAFGGETASQMSSNSPTRGLPYITNVLTTNPDADLVHLSIGGNDVLGSWNPAFTPAQEDALFQSISNDIATVVNHILSIRPDIQVYHPTYDYLPATTFDPLRFNPVLDSGAVFSQTLADSIPRMTFHNSLGLMQVHFGIPSLGIPPFDPSLPDPTFASPEIAFADAIHLTADGYSIFAQEAFDVFYESQLVPEPGADFDEDGDVDGADFLYWQLNDGSESNLDLWKANFGNDASPMTAASTGVPEPTTGFLLMLGIASMLFRRHLEAS